MKKGKKSFVNRPVILVNKQGQFVFINRIIFKGQKSFFNFK